MEAVDAKVDGRTLTSFDDFIVDLLLDLRHHLFDAGGVDTSVGDELVEGQAADFAAHGVEGADDDGLGGVVYHDFNACGGFEGTDVAAFAADDATLHLVVVDMEHGDAVLDGSFGGHALDGLDDDALGLLVGGEFGIVHDVVDIALGIAAGFVLERINESFLGFVGRESAEFLEFFAFLELEFFEFLLLAQECLLLAGEAVLGVVEFLLAASEFFLALSERHFALLQFVLHLENALVALLHFLFEFSFLVEELFLYFEEFLLLDDFCLLVGVVDHPEVFLLQCVTEEGISACCSE